jgi:prepilin-type N-terminal cleavage/methylation domain-containing protein
LRVILTIVPILPALTVEGMRFVAYISSVWCGNSDVDAKRRTAEGSLEWVGSAEVATSDFGGEGLVKMHPQEDEKELLRCELSMRPSKFERSEKMAGFRHWLARFRCRDCQRGFAFATNCETGRRRGFTMIEIVIVMVIIALVAMMAIPMMTSASSMQIRSAADMISADLEYAKSMAISRQKIYSVVFNKTNESYQIEDANGVIDHPVKKGFKYVVNFSTDSRVSEVDIADVDFDSTSEVKFDYLGSPYNGGRSPLNSGVIRLQANERTAIINVEPVTGFISVSD